MSRYVKTVATADGSGGGGGGAAAGISLAQACTAACCVIAGYAGTAFACGSFAPQKESWKKTDIRSVQLRKGLSDPARRAGDAATEIDVAKLRPRFEMVLFKLPS